MEPAALAAQSLPELTARPALHTRIIRDGRLSSAQLDSLMLGIQAHETRLANGARRGFLIGDGAGVGKGASPTIRVGGRPRRRRAAAGGCRGGGVGGGSPVRSMTKMGHGERAASDDESE